MRLIMALAVAACAAAWGDVWLGPAAGWTRAAGYTGYAETDGKDVGRSAAFWGAAGGYARGPLRVEGRVAFPPGGSDEALVPVGWVGERKTTSYDEFNCDLGGMWLLSKGALRPSAGLSVYWGHATYEGINWSLWTPAGGGPRAVYGRAVNDLFVGPAAAAELRTGPVMWRGVAAFGYRTHHEAGGEWRVVSYESGFKEKGFVPYSLVADFVAAQGTVAGSWRVGWRFRLEWWLEGRADAFGLGGDVSDEAEERARYDVAFGVAPVLAF
jgi:hypothetical protein